MWPPRPPWRFTILAASLIIFFYVSRPWAAYKTYKKGELEFLKYGDGQTGMDKLIKSSYGWSKLKQHNPVSSLKQLPTGKPLSLPPVQHEFTTESDTENAVLESHRLEIRKAFQKCWKNYKDHAWMRDELTPISGKGKDTFGGWAATMIDSLDTLWIMDLKDEFREAVEAVATIDWENTQGSSLNLFETTIRHLGGLLAAYDLSHEQVLLIKAVELGDMLFSAFDTSNRMPGFWLNYDRAKTGSLEADLRQPSASPCSLSLEFTRLSQVTGDPKYYDAISRITRLLDLSQNSTLLPSFTLGAEADSLYEYLPKMYGLLGGLDPVYEKLAKYSLDTAKKNILFRPCLPGNDDILLSGTATASVGGVNLSPEGQHLGCFTGGMYALAGKLFAMDQYVDIGAKLTRGCMYAYNAFPSGIMPEIFNMWACDTLDGCDWDEKHWEKNGNKQLPKGFRDVRVSSYILRPEAIESVFLLYRMTGQKEFQDQAWKMWQAIQKATDTEYGNAGINDVTTL